MAISVDFEQYFENMIDGVMIELPSVLKAILFLLLAWLIAIIARSIVQKLFVKMGVDRALSKIPAVQTEDEGERILKNVGNLIYFLVFILFLPAVFDALNMTEVSTPISNMMNTFIGFIPNIIATAVIVVIGVFVAKMVKQLFLQFFEALSLDKLLNKVKPGQTDYRDERSKLSNVLANIIYIIVLIPFISIGLESLNIDTISNPVQSVLNDVMAMIPNIFVALILVLIGYYIGKLLGNLLTNLLQGTNIANIYQSLGLTDEDKQPSFDLAKVSGKIVQGLILLFFTVEALRVINLQVLNTIGHAIIQYVPFLLSALIILGAGLLLANVLGNWMEKNTKHPSSALLLKSIIIIFAVFMTLEQLHFATSIVNTAFLLVLGGLMVAFAISFGIGGREFAESQLTKLQQKLDRDKDE